MPLQGEDPFRLYCSPYWEILAAFIGLEDALNNIHSEGVDKRTISVPAMKLVTEI